MPTDKSNQINDADEIDTSKTYLITGASLKKMLATIKANRPLAGINITLREGEKGTFIDGA